MKHILFLIFIPLLSLGQEWTYVPDDNFEQTLIDLGYDDELNDSVLKSNIDTVMFLSVSNQNIFTLIGIEDFNALQILRCSGNMLSELNLNSNFNLRRLFCGGNQLSSLDLANNINLIVLRCGNNQLLDLDLANNSLLQELFCRNNELLNLNLKNGNNLALDSLFITNNPNLSCVEADNLNYLTTNFNVLGGSIDSQHYFSSNCNKFNLEEPYSSGKIIRTHSLLGGTSNNAHFFLKVYDNGTVEKIYSTTSPK